MNQTNRELTSNVNNCNSKIEKAFNQFHQQIENKKTEIQKSLKKKEQEKRNYIHAKSQQLQKEKNDIKNAIKSVSSLVGDENINRWKRKEKILSVKTRVSDNRCEIIIADTGPGIPAENKEKIFEPLFSTKIYGVGLGLSIVNQIMRQHNGGVEMVSIINEGTTFTLWLPVDRKE